jgi:CelD/BcsL family acetyltransferase involved in cellulose biosynthesis
MRDEVLQREDQGRDTPAAIPGGTLQLPGRLRVVEVDPLHDARWERFVFKHPDGLIYHHPAWLGILEQEFGQRSIGLACIDDTGELQGILPLAWTRGLPFITMARTGRRLSSLPRTPVAGPLSLHHRATAALIEAAIDHAREIPGARLELKPPPTPGPLNMLGDLTRVPWGKAFVLELPSHFEDLVMGTSRNRARISWAVRKASRLGVTVRRAETRADLLLWYQLYLETMRSHSLPPRPLRLFDAIWAELGVRGLMQLLLAVRGRDIVAGSLYLMFGATVFYAFNGCRRSELALRPNDVIQWHAIRDSCREGYRFYDLGEVSHGNRGLADFKSKWGATARQMYRYYHPRPAHAETDGGWSEADTSAPRIVEAAWRRLPLAVTAAVGSRVYRFM